MNIVNVYITSTYWTTKKLDVVYGNNFFFFFLRLMKISLQGSIWLMLNFHSKKKEEFTILLGCHLKVICYFSLLRSWNLTSMWQKVDVNVGSHYFLSTNLLTSCKEISRIVVFNIFMKFKNKYFIAALQKKPSDFNWEASDMWSFAILLWELATREVPFADLSPMECGMKVMYFYVFIF